MIKLDKTKSYYLGDLSNEQFSEINELLVNDKEAKWTSVILEDIKHLYLFFSEIAGWYAIEDECNDMEVINALELFYTLENVQVDCRALSEEQIKSMCEVYDINGYELWSGYVPLKIADNFHYFRLHTNDTNMYLVDEISEEKHTITYDKFMELFSKEEENVLTEIMKDEYKPTFCDEVKSNKPQHYSKGIDTFKRMEENCTLEERLAFAKGNIDKYTWRTKGQDKEDFVKIISYSKWAIKQLENEQYTK